MRRVASLKLPFMTLMELQGNLNYGIPHNPTGYVSRFDDECYVELRVDGLSVSLLLYSRLGSLLGEKALSEVQGTHTILANDTEYEITVSPKV